MTNELRARFAADHTGMRVDYSGMLKHCQSGLRREPSLAEMLRQLQEHVREMGARFYAGDVSAVDEFLQLYCVEREARAAALAAAPSTSPAAAAVAVEPNDVSLSRRYARECLKRQMQPVYDAFAATPTVAGDLAKERAMASIRRRASEHPRVLEIMADCADAIDAECSSIDGPASPVWMELAAEFRAKSAAILAEDPDLWERDYAALRPMTLGEQVRDAQQKVEAWSPEKRANVQLEGTKGGITE